MGREGVAFWAEEGAKSQRGACAWYWGPQSSHEQGTRCEGAAGRAKWVADGQTLGLTVCWEPAQGLAWSSDVTPALAGSPVWWSGEAGGGSDRAAGPPWLPGNLTAAWPHPLL